jgi:hypothetical protein
VHGFRTGVEFGRSWEIESGIFKVLLDYLEARHETVWFCTSIWPDVYPGWRSRVPIVGRASLDPVRQIDFDEHISPETTSLAGIYGPGGLCLHGSHEGTEGGDLGGRLRELIRLIVSREMD